ncbi:hypothetical protein ACRV0D_001533 [Enterobacter hormaechei]
MTPANENAIRAACRRCTEEIQQAMRKKPKPNWNETVPPIIKKHLWELASWSSSSKLAAELSRRIEQMAVDAEKNEGGTA